MRNVPWWCMRKKGWVLHAKSNLAVHTVGVENEDEDDDDEDDDDDDDDDDVDDDDDDD